MNTENLFIHVGMGTIVQRSRILFVTIPGSTTAQRYVDFAKQTNKFHNACLGRHYRSLMVLDDGTVIMCTVKPLTLMGRLNGVVVPDAKSEEVTGERVLDLNDELDVVDLDEAEESEMENEDH